MHLTLTIDYIVLGANSCHTSFGILINTVKAFEITIRILMAWMARELSDCEEDLQKLATDLLSSIKSRLAKVSGIQHKLVCMDLDQLVGCMAGECNKQSVVRIDEAKLKHFAKEKFKDFYEYVCTQNHVQKLAELKELNLEPALAHVIHRKLKETLKMLIWIQIILIFWQSVSR